MKSLVKRVVAAAALAFPLSALAQSATPAPHLDLTRLAGVWFELAHLPNKAQKQCVHDATTLYALGDKPGRIQVVKACVLADGTSDARNSSGRTADKSSDGKLKVPYYFFFSKKYWVLAVDPDYQWAIVGTPNHKSLWLLSKSLNPAPTLLPDLEARAAAQGFNTAKLIHLPHTP